MSHSIDEGTYTKKDISQIILKGEIVKELLAISTTFPNYFSNVAERCIAKSYPNVTYCRDNLNSLFFYDILSEEMSRTFKKIKVLWL